MKALQLLLDVIFPPRATERLVRDATPETLGALVSPLVIPGRHGEIVALLPYRHPLVAALIIEAKYRGNRRACELLGGVLADYLAEFSADQDMYERSDLGLIPVPLSRERLGERGYNQAERIVACALSRLGLTHTPGIDTLVRTRDTASQATLSREERLRNTEGAFAARNVNASLTYVLVDDVVTTGATFASATSALHDAGASAVICIALAH